MLSKDPFHRKYLNLQSLQTCKRLYTFSHIPLIDNLRSLGSNELTGSIPSQIGTLTTLNVLYIDKPMFLSTDPSHGSKLENNQLRGTIPKELIKLKKLRILYSLFNAHEPT